MCAWYEGVALPTTADAMHTSYTSVTSEMACVQGYVCTALRLMERKKTATACMSEVGWIIGCQEELCGRYFI